MRRLSLLCLTLTNCAALAVATAPKKVPSVATSAGTAAAERFWAIFHEGRLDEVDTVAEAHMRVLVDEPADAVTVSHLGWLHAWKLAERTREPRNASTVNHAFLARRYFAEAVALKPDEPRFLGFYASFTMAEASILKNERQLREGYFVMKDAVAAWPEFNLFTSGYTMSTNPTSGPQFKEGLEQQWQTLDLCTGTKVSRTAPDLHDYMTRETKEGPKRACFNSWIAPHNWEGFALNFGDMLVRNGDVKNARTMYGAAKLSKTYDAWPYRAVLERRLASVDGLKARFESASDTEPEMTPMFNSAFSCMACHQEKGAPSVQ